MYEKGKYGAALACLEEGINNNPDDSRLQNYLDAYRVIYVTSIIESANSKCEEGKYKEAKNIVAEALAEYDCDEFRLLSQSVNEQSKIKNRLKKNFMEKFELLAQGWNREKAKVEKDGASSYVTVSGKKLILGDYSDDDITILSFGGDILAAIVNVDFIFDVRDLTYDITHWGEEEYFAIYLATDVVALLPVIGCLKYFMVDDAVAQGIKKAPDLIHNLKKVADVADTVSDTAKETEKLAETADKAREIIKKAESAPDAARQIEKHYQYVATRNSHYVNRVYPDTKVPFVRKQMDYENGNLGNAIEIVVPQFASAADIQLPKELWKESFSKQKTYLRKELQKMVESGDPEILSKFSKEAIEDIKNGIIPEGYVWHHNEEEGLMQLVDEVVHKKTGHTGGNALWGIGNE